MVEWLARWFGGRGVAVGIVSRGYRSAAGGMNDEAKELAQKLPGVPHVQNPDRVAAAREAIERHGCKLILLDDGFQHRRLHRDLDIVLIDALEPFGYGHVFPRGLLREPIAGLRRVDVVVLSRADLVDEPQRREIELLIRRYAPKTVWAEACHRPTDLIDAAGGTQSLEWLRGRRIAAFCGIGNPAGFRRTLDQCGCEIVAFREFPDHHHYDEADVRHLAAAVSQFDAQALVTTHKDVVKLDFHEVAGQPVWAVRIGLAFLHGEGPIEVELRSIASKISSAGRETACGV
jgi:tetraacyldisaccharide 4'-kinase